MSLYLMKHSRPALANATWKLSKVMDSGDPAVFLEMHHEIKYTLHTKNLRLNIESIRNGKVPWDVICLSRKEFAGGSVMRRFVN